MCVIEVQRMGERSVHQHRSGWRIAGRIREDTRFARTQPHRPHGREKGRGALGIMARANGIADKVQEEETGTFRQFG